METDSVVVEKKPKARGGLFTRLKKIKHIELIVAGIAVVIMLVLYFTHTLGGGGNAPQTITGEEFTARMERQLTEALSQMEGAGDTRVIINWESSVERVIAYIINETQSGTTKTPQIINVGGGVQSPVILREIYPAPLGVIIMTQGGADVRIRLELINAVSTLLRITPDRIQVLTMR